MSLPELLVGVSILAGGSFVFFGTLALGYSRALRVSQDENKRIGADLSEALRLSTTAQNVQLQAERNLQEYKQQVDAFLKRPLTVNAVISPEQMEQLAATIKSGPATPFLKN